ncbi:hypothetical protein M885DRAFT_140666 [Pelagophyceae sp. CCMP2097]|nr:hypothetical protein M885DRAFT_140666 [Pelagophyceae sp. CCMP2097]
MSPRPTPEEAHVDVTVEDDVAVGDPPTRSRTLSSVLHGLRELPKDPDSPRPRANTASRPRAATRLSVDDDDDDEDEDDDNFDVDKGPRWLEAFIEGVKWARSLVLWVFVVVCFGLALLSVPYDGGQSHRRQGRGGVLRWREALICARRLGAGAAVGRGLSGSVRFLGLLIADFSPQFGHFNEAFEWLALEVLMASLGVAVTGMIRDPRDKGQASAVGHLRLPRPLERRLRLALVNAVVAAFGYAFQEFGPQSKADALWTAVLRGATLRRIPDASRRPLTALGRRRAAVGRRRANHAHTGDNRRRARGLRATPPPPPRGPGSEEGPPAAEVLLGRLYRGGPLSTFLDVRSPRDGPPDGPLQGEVRQMVM